VPVLSDVTVVFFISVVVLNLNGSFLVVPILHSASDVFHSYIVRRYTKCKESMLYGLRPELFIIFTVGIFVQYL